MNETLVLFQCVQYMDETTFAAMLPRLQELLRTSVGLGTRVATAHFIVLLCHHLTTQQFQPYVGMSRLASHSAFHLLDFHLWPQIRLSFIYFSLTHVQDIKLFIINIKVKPTKGAIINKPSLFTNKKLTK